MVFVHSDFAPTSQSRCRVSMVPRKSSLNLSFPKRRRVDEESARKEKGNTRRLTVSALLGMTPLQGGGGSCCPQKEGGRPVQGVTVYISVFQLSHPFLCPSLPSLRCVRALFRVCVPSAARETE